MRTEVFEMPYGKIRQVVCGPCTVAEHKGIGYLAGRHVTGRRRRRRVCPYQGVPHGINGRHGGIRKALFRRKGDEARNYGSAFIGVDEGPYHRAGTIGSARRGVWFIGDYDGDIGTYAFCLTSAGSPRWKLSTAWSSGKYENGFTVHSGPAAFFRALITAAREENDKGRRLIVTNLFRDRLGKKKRTCRKNLLITLSPVSRRMRKLARDTSLIKISFVN